MSGFDELFKEIDDMKKEYFEIHASLDSMSSIDVTDEITKWQKKCVELEQRENQRPRRPDAVPETIERGLYMEMLMIANKFTKELLIKLAKIQVGDMKEQVEGKQDQKAIVAELDLE